MRQALAGKTTPEKVRKALTEFEESFRRVNLNLPLLASEISSGEFHRDGKGRAGEFFRSFAEIVTLLQDTPASDTPWELMNQLAMKINNQVSGFNQSYLFLKALETIKTASLPGGFATRSPETRNFFREFLLENIDDAVVARDDKRRFTGSTVLGLYNDEFERKYLLSKRSVLLKDRQACSTLYYGRDCSCFCSFCICPDQNRTGNQKEPES